MSTGTNTPPRHPRSPQAVRARLALGLLLLTPAGIALLAGLDAALMMLDLPAPVRVDRLPEVHGMLMVLGFVGTLIALERAVALKHPLGFAAPALLGLGALLLVSPAPLVVGQCLLMTGAAALVGLYQPLWHRQRDEAVLVQALGAVLALGAAVLWLGGTAVPLLAPWLVGFVVLTIAGERLELAKITMAPSAGSRLVLLASGLTAGVMAALLWPRPGTALLGAALLLLTGWLAAHDVARRMIHTSGLTRYMAGCMLAGYFWLGVAGAIWLLGGPALEGVRYDAVLHAVFLGFALSMIMAHAPVILPAVLRRRLPYHPALIAPAALLHLSLALRLWGGDALGSHAAWVTGGVLNVVAVLSFLAVAAGSTIRGNRGPS
ncbi:hypothetical protein [Nocardioides sp.]|uniref:hypothetical protein n=1 Tax=Nocardioides sp. TaxID=35761 RepID=UPI00286DB534|nr:hypothetical protein [Nocardioides sp.]